jgi:hypothetical protein
VLQDSLDVTNVAQSESHWRCRDPLRFQEEVDDGRVFPLFCDNVVPDLTARSVSIGRLPTSRSGDLIPGGHFFCGALGDAFFCSAPGDA